MIISFKSNLPNGIINGGIIGGNMLGSMPMPGAGGKFGREVPMEVGLAPLVAVEVPMQKRAGGNFSLWLLQKNIF